MAYKCAWCLKDGATRKVTLDSDGSTEGYRYYCDAAHQAFWETNQPRPIPGRVAMEAASMGEIIKNANLDSWYLISLGQYGMRDRITWRAVFQRRTVSGATEEVFTEYEDAPDPRLAVLEAYKRCRVVMRLGEPAKTIPKTREVTSSGIPAKLEKSLEKAIDTNWLTRKRRRATGRVHRENDL